MARKDVVEEEVWTNSRGSSWGKGQDMSDQNVHPERHRFNVHVCVCVYMCVCVCAVEILPARGFSIVTAVFRNRCNIGSETSSRLESLRKISPQSILPPVPANFTLTHFLTAFPPFKHNLLDCTDSSCSFQSHQTTVCRSFIWVSFLFLYCFFSTAATQSKTN